MEMGRVYLRRRDHTEEWGENLILWRAQQFVVLLRKDGFMRHPVQLWSHNDVGA
jgi:hypothetical protein